MVESDRIHLLAIVSVSIALAGGAIPVAAQNRAPELEEIVVTAQKREQSAQDIGISISAFSGDRLRELGVNTIDRALARVPGTGLFDVTGGGVPVLVVRGVGLQNFRINDTPTTAVYVDDVYQTSVALAATSFFDLERLEILKGPQGGLYGRNAVGGAVQVITQRPDTDAGSGYASLGYGRYGRVEVEGAANYPLSEQFATRVSARLVRSDDTQFHSTSGNFDHGEADQWSMRGQLLYTSDGSDWLLKLEAGEDQSETPLLRAVEVWEPLGLNLVPGQNIADGAVLNVGGFAPSLASVCAGFLAGKREPTRCQVIDGTTPQSLGLNDAYDSASDFRNALDNSWQNATLRGDLEFGDYTLTSITAYGEFEHGRKVDFDAVPTIQQHVLYASEIEMLSQEFRLAWDTGGDFSWIVGASYAKDELEESTSLTGETGLLPLAFGGLTVAEQPYTQETEAWAVYGHAEWQLTANVDVILEGRYTHEDKSLDGGVFLPQAGFFLTYADDSESYAGATGKLAVEWSVTDAAMLYASLAHGFKSGGFFGGFATSNEQLEPFDEETILAYELGFKSDFPEARARLNGAVYYYDRSDIQAGGYDTTGTIGIQRLTNVGDGEVYGAELEAIWSPTDQLRLQAGLAYVHSEIVDSDKTTADVFASTTTAPYEGATLPNQPEFSASLLAGYDVALSTDWTLGIELEYLYRSEQDLRIVVLPEERGIAEEDAYGLTNLRLTLSQTSGGISLAAFCNNVFGEEYRTVLTKDDLGGVYEIYGDPLTWGLTLRYEF